MSYNNSYIAIARKSRDGPKLTVAVYIGIATRLHSHGFRICGPTILTGKEPLTHKNLDAGKTVREERKESICSL